MKAVFMLQGDCCCQVIYVIYKPGTK